MIPFMWNSRIGKMSYRDRSQNSGCFEWGELSRSGYKGIFWGDEDDLYLDCQLHGCRYFSKCIELHPMICACHCT